MSARYLKMAQICLGTNIPDAFSYQCHVNGSAGGPIALGAHALDWMPDQNGEWAMCVPPASAYENHIVRDDPSGTAWLVKSGRRYWIHTASTYRCFLRRGAGGLDNLPPYALDALPDQDGQWAVCN